MSGVVRMQDEKAVKATVIETEFVKTDEANFKYVVHQFTGNDSKVATTRNVMSGVVRMQDEKAAKVTVIETKFVKTDEANFKYAVHQFTGNDSKVATAPQTSILRPQVRRAVPMVAQSQMEVGNASEASEAASLAQNGAMVNGEAAFMMDLEPFLEDMYRFTDK